MSTENRASLLRIATAGSVDDGKSTLVGRLLHDTKNILVDQLDAIERVSQSRGLDAADLALLTDGLRAEREQGITIDVAYRYFATPARSFILADCPGHVQYTRNTVTGASTADALIVLVDITHGIMEQTRRHLAVGALLGVPHLIIAVNKIDLLPDAEEAFRELSGQLHELADELGVLDLRIIPVSALRGDNVVEASQDTPWYDGPSLLSWLENLPDSSELTQAERFALPVQCVIRPQSAALSPEFVDYRGYAGQIASGSVAVGDEVAVQPAGRTTTVERIDVAGAPAEYAVAGQSVTLTLADQIDITRGDLIAEPAGAPSGTKSVEAVVCWLDDEKPLREGQRVLLKHTTRVVRGIVGSLDGRLNLESLAAESVESFELNDIGRVTVRVAEPLFTTAYTQSHALGSFLLIDPQSGRTQAAGMVQDDSVNTPGVLGNLRADAGEWAI
ncbi:MULTISPECIES: sulfate adenylyltransferase subunit 1 [Kocuria]|uniref:sulfate adenylyltransferase subunit 1 n=1 Tax=Kocuria TaxID=57493 RepID=UPI000BF02339|nr:GTP-binding protein [Kocuria indica]MBN6810714.1 50S ribosome-binding GTPase [Kocuria indica]MBN6842658.1 50S ribosome-binding GTPase [Kocuria indica]GHD84682.1 sulfate adenylyltransferase subunit 1 [Kocuria marina]